MTHPATPDATDPTTKDADLKGADVAAVFSAARGGDPAGWTELVRRYRPAIQAAVAPYRLGDADAADVVQTTWLRLLEHGHSVRDPERLGGWLATTARRESLAVLRRRRGEVLVDTDRDTPASGPTPEAVVVDADVRREVRAVAAELTGRPALLVAALFSRQRVPYAEISSRLDIPVGSIGPTRSRALNHLRRRLEDRLDDVALCG